jgi:hypothetical protein
MSASQIRQYPYNEIFTNVGRIFSTMGDQPDRLFAMSQRRNLPAEQRKAASDLLSDICASTSGVCWSIDDLMGNIDDVGALGHFSRHANTLEELAERAMVMILEGEAAS